ncbi:MAG: hypothetical protein L7U62_06420 [Candidatus Poseidoniaceae archaeon]|nr:hypothetical protein [Candidatus Poseidoniaceae archaeon]
MATPTIDEASSLLLDELGVIGPFLGPLMLAVSLFLMFRGHERLQLVAGMTGAGIGFIITPLVYTTVWDFGFEIDQLYVMILLIVLCGVFMSATIQLSIRIMAGFLIYVSFAGVFEFLQGKGFEIVEGDLIQGLMAIIAFFSVRWIKNILPVLVSGLLGSLGTMGGMLLLTGNPLTLMSTRNTSTLLMLAILFLLSFSWQYSQIKAKKEKQNQEPTLPQMQQVPGSAVKPRRRRGNDLPDLRDFS